MKTNFCLLLLLFVIASCSSDSENESEMVANPTPEEETTEDDGPVVSQGAQVFQIDFSEFESKNPPQGNYKNLEPAFALISLLDASENEVYTREPFALSENEGKYETDEIVLDSGTYTVTEFIVVDTNDVIISLVPQEGSALALFTDTTLPFEFTVLEEQTNISPTDNIEAAGLTAVDFGYGELNLDFPESTDFFSMTVDETPELTTKILTLESVTGAVFIVDWGDGSIEEYVSNVTDSGFENTITHNYLENGEYTINVSGPVAAIELLNFASDQESNWQSQINSVSLEKLVLLRHCTIYSGNLTTIDLTTNTALEFLELGNNQITSLDISNNANLKHLSVPYNQLNGIDLSNNVNLEFVVLLRNQITSLDISNNSTLYGLTVRDNQLTSLDISNNTAMNYLDCASNMLTSIDVSQNTNMANLNVGDNMLTSIDVSQNTNLKRLDLWYNQISAIDLSNNTSLEGLYIQGNLLSTIDLTNNPEMERLIIEDNNFSSLDLTSTPKIFDLQIGRNQFDAITLDEIISHVHEQATTNTITNGYMDFKNNPGSDGISNASLVKINELISSYDWFFNNNN